MRFTQKAAWLVGCLGLTLLLACVSAVLHVTPTPYAARTARGSCDQPPLARPLQLPLVLASWQEIVGKPSKSQRPYLGFQSCYECHDSGTKGEIVIGGVKINLLKEKWVYYTEIPIWSKQDKHVQAYTVLLNKRSEEMGKHLGVTEIHRDQRCLACHTGFPLSQMPTGDDGLVDKKLAENLNINLGVSCEGCHGPSGDYKSDNKVVLNGWINAHKEKPIALKESKAWRHMTPKMKQEEFGFVDVRSAAGKTKLCVSCHIGDVEQGRVITHEMYAAGHPPLPGFEMETFVEQMPRHWAEFSAKFTDVQDRFLKYTQDPLYKPESYKKDALHRTKSLLTGAFVAASEYLRYVGNLADNEAKSPLRKPDWPEFASYDCYSCHHELKNPQWRQNRNPQPKIPGRPGLQDWQFVLTKIALTTLGNADFDARMEDIRKAINSRPLGDQKDVKEKAKAASDWFLSKGLELEKKPVSREQGLALLKQIAAVGSTQSLDYDSARQLVWAFKVVGSDLKSNLPEAAQILAVLEPPAPAKEMFLLDLRRGRKAATGIPGEDGKRETVEIDLELVYPIMTRYHPAEFQKRFTDIKELLK